MSIGGRVSCLNFLNIFYTFVKKKKKTKRKYCSSEVGRVESAAAT